MTQIKKSPILAAVKRKLISSINRILHRSDVRLVEAFPAFAPNSPGSYTNRASLTIQAATQIFPLIAELIRSCHIAPIPELLPIESFSNNASAKVAAIELKTLFDKYGSDKSSIHDYHYLYAAILKDRNAALDILEVGLGTNNVEIVSNMGRQGRPGASLRAFREFLPQARIYGADVDKRILFEEARIRTFFVDQTNLKSFDYISNTLKNGFDVIIDDGLHSPNANIATLIFAMRQLKEDGWFVVEDISCAALPVWQVVAALVAGHYRCWLLSARAGNLFVVRKRKQRRQ